MAEFLNQENFQPFIEASTLPVLVDFYKDGCIPCRRVAPLLSKAGEAYAGRLIVARVNLSQNPGLAAQYRIEAAPTLLLLKSGKEAARHRGIIDRAGLAALIEENLGNTGAPVKPEPAKGVCMMKITVAGNQKEYEEGLTVEQLIAAEKVESPLYVTVTVNDDFVATEERETRRLRDGDVVEFLYFMGGGC